MAIEGRLQDASLADICQLLAMGRKTGCLTVTDRSNFGYVYFDGGRVVHASVLNRPDRLGDVLVKQGVITPEALVAAIEKQGRHPDQRLGQILIDDYGLTQEQLQKFVSVQIEEAVYHLFAWETGSFRFEPGERPDADQALLVSLSAEGLLLEGARRVDEWSLIEKKVPSTNLVFTVEGGGESKDSEAELTAEQEVVLPLLDGKRTVDDVVTDSGLVEFDVAKAIYGLVQAGYVTSAGAKEPGRARKEPGVARHLELGEAFYRAGMLEDAEAEYRAALDLDPGLTPARTRLGLIGLRTERPEVALEHIDALLEIRRDDVDALRNRSLALEMLGRIEEALATLDRAAECDSENGHVLLARAVLLLKTRQADRAMEAFHRYRKSSGGDSEPAPMYYAYAILAATEEGELEEAIRLGREGLERYPTSSPILVNLGVVLERKGETDAAEALYLRAVQQAAPLPQAHKNLGDLAYGRGDRAGAQAHYERAVKLDPGLGDDTYSKLGELVYKEGDMGAARALWQRALELNPENKVVRTNLTLVPKASGS